MSIYNKHMPNQTLCSYTLFHHISLCDNGDKCKAPHKCCHEVLCLCLSDQQWSVQVNKMAAIVGECPSQPHGHQLIHLSYDEHNSRLSVTVQIQCPVSRVLYELSCVFSMALLAYSDIMWEFAQLVCQKTICRQGV